jgi:Fe2+ transport system protein B
VDLSAIGGAENLELLFFRRNTVIHIRMSDTANKDYITSYAQKMDERLTPQVVDYLTTIREITNQPRSAT